jgi:hypothetical protein
MPTAETPALWLQNLSLWGSFLSGLFAMATFAVAGWAVWKTLPQFQRTKRAERTAEVAETLWVSAFRLVTALKAITDPAVQVPSGLNDVDEAGHTQSPGRRFLEARAEQRRQVAEFSNGMLDAWGLAGLHFDESVTGALDRLWNARSRVVSDFSLHARDLDNPGMFPDASRRLFEGEDRQTIEACEAELKRVLGPIARHAVEHKLPALPVSTPSVAPTTPAT